MLDKYVRASLIPRPSHYPVLTAYCKWEGLGTRLSENFLCSLPQNTLCLSLPPSGEDYEKIVFLFQLEKGQAGGSYGLNVAALAGLDRSILRVARRKSKEMEMATTLDESRGMEGVLDQSKIQAFRRVMELVNSDEYGRGSLTKLISDSL